MGNQSEKSSPETTFEFPDTEGGVRYIYGNQFHLDWTGHDIRIRVGELSLAPPYKAAPGQIVRVEDKVSISMSWSMAKNLMQQLAGAISRYEELNGEVHANPQPPPGQ